MGAYEDRRKKQEKKYGGTSSPETTSSATAKAASSGESKYLARRKKQQGNISSVDDSFINTFISDAKRYMDTAESDYNGITFENKDSVYEERKKQADDLRSRSWKIREYLESNKDKFDADSYNSFKTYLDAFDKASGSNMYAFYNVKERGGYWLKYSGKSYDEIQAAFETLDDGEEKDWLSNYQYEVLKTSADYDSRSTAGWEKYLADQEKKRKAQEDARENESFLDKLGRWLGPTGAVDTSIPLGNAPEITHTLSADTSYLRPNQNWTDEQKGVYGYLYDADKTAAGLYAKNTTERNNQEENAKKIAAIEEWATRSGWTGSAATLGAIAAMPLSLTDTLSALTEYNARGFVSTSATPLPGQVSNAITGAISTVLNEKSGTISEKIPVIGGKGLGDAYQLGTSIANSMISAYTQGSIGTYMVFFGSASSSAMYDAKDRGASDDQAITLGILSGLAEAAGEAFSVEHLLGLGGKELSGFFFDVLKQAGVEASEEGVTTLLNNFSEQLVMGDKSNFNVLVNYYMTEKGLSESEAKKKAWLDMANDLAFDMFGGAISGGVSGGLQTGVQTMFVNHVENERAQQIYGAEPGALVNEALEIDPDNAFAQKMQGRLDSGKNLSGGQLNRLVQQNEAALRAQDISNIQSAAESRLAELGETGDVAAVAAALTKQVAGEKLTKAERQLISGSKYGQRVANELNTENIQSGEYASAWAEGIGTDRINAEEYSRLVESAEVQEPKQTASPLEEASKKYGAQAQAMIHTYVSGQDVEKYDQSYQVAYDMGKAGVAFSYVEKSPAVSYLTDSQKQLAYEAGQAAANDGASLVEAAVSEMNVSEETAQSLISQFNAVDGVSAETYATDIPLAYKYGKLNYKAGLKNLNLTAEQAQNAFQRGREDAKAAATEKANVKAKPTANTVSNESVKKKIIFEGFTYDEKTAKPLQQASIAAIDVINKMSSLEVHVYKSVKKNGKYYAIVNGKERLAPNGYFTEGNKIYIDINAGNHGQGAMLYTFGHEVGHYIAEWNAEDFKAISDFLFEHYGENVPIDEMLEAQKQKLINSYKADGKEIPSNSELERMAQEELVCDMLSEMFADERAIEKLAELKQKDLKLHQKLGAAIKKLLDKLKELLNVYKGQNPDFMHAASVENFGKEAFEQLQDLYMRAFVKADENFQGAEVQKNTTEDGDVDGESDIKLSEREEDAFKPYAKKINTVINQSIAGKGHISGKVQVKEIMPVGPRLAAMVAASSGNSIDISNKSIALNSGEIWHEYDRHTDVGDEISRGQIAFTKRQFQNAVKCIISPDMVETIFSSADNPTQNQSFAYVKKTDRGHYVVVEAVGGKRSPYIYPVMILQFSKSKWNKMMAEGKTLGELLLENDPKKLKALDVEQNKKSRVSAAQFASYEAIANTLRSSQLDTKISQADPVVNSESTEAMDIEVDENTESVAPAVFMSERTWTESDYVQEREKAAKEIAKAIGVYVKKAKAYIDSVNSIAKMIAEDRVRLDYFSSPGRSSFVGNVEYGGSFDFSTLCKKRRLLTGTFTAIQKALPNTALTADEILDIRNRMKDAGLEVSCGLCYVEGSRANMGQFAKEFLRLYKQYYPDAWQPNMVDVNTPEGIEWVRINHPEAYEQYEYFWNHYGTLKDGDKNLFASQQKPKLYQLHTEYKGEILDKFNDDENVEEKNLNGGIRLQSFSDFEIVHLIDTMQIIMDMSRVGLAGQAYTKVPDFAWALGDTGLKINLSLIAKGVDENGRLIFDDVEGMPIDKAVELRNRYSKNVGTILVAFNDEQLLAAMADDRVDFIIPFHRSQWKKSQYGAMGLPAKTKDYTYMQNEKFIKPQYHEYRGRMVKDKATNYMPNEYWDFSKSGKENAEAYLEMCARNNKRPKFYKLLQNNGDGSYSLKADGSTDGYWKLLIDFKMYDNDGNGSPQMPVKPEFNMDEATRMLNEYSGGHSNFPVAQGIVDEFVQEYKDSHKGAKFSDRDTSYLDAVNRGDMETAQKMVDEAADAAGFTAKGYHGSRTPGFTVIDKYSWLWLARDKFAADTYGVYQEVDTKGKPHDEKGVYAMRYNPGNNLVVYADGASWGELPVTEDEYPGVFADEETGDITTDSMAEWAARNGYDSITFVDVMDGGGSPTTVDVVFNPNRDAKSADPVTYDDSGDVIPLSERFNQENDDIRYSDRDVVDNSTLIGKNNTINKRGDKDVNSMKRDGIDIQIEQTHTSLSILEKNRDFFSSGWAKKKHSELAQKLDDLLVEKYGISGRHQQLLDDIDAKQAELEDAMLNNSSKAVIEKLEQEYADAENALDVFADKYLTADHYDDSFLVSDDTSFLFQDRADDSVSNRSLLANAFEGVAQNEIEKNKIQEYKDKIDLIDAEEQKLSELNEQIKELSFAKGPRDTKAIRNLQLEARQTANRINTYDKQLLRLEASKPLQDVLTREKKMAYQRAEQKGKEALAAYRERATKTQRELLEKWQESRKKGIDSRHRTAMRHKIKDVVNELNQYLLRGTKDRHVPIELQKAVAEALDAVNMDTVGAEERIAKLKDELLKAKTPEQIQEISRKIDNVQAMGDKMNGRLKKLKDAYDQFVNSDDPLIANSHDEVISNKLQSVIESIGNTPLRDMTLTQLEDVYDMYRMVLTTIRNANKAFKAKRSESISVIANQVMVEVEKVGGKKKQSLAMLNGIKSFGWNNLKPVYAFEHIGSDHFTEVFNNVRAGEDVWAVDVTEAREFYLDKAKKHNYDSWDFKKRYKFTSASGMDFELSLEQIMSLYAYSKRDQAADHLKKGGIVIDETTEITVKTKLGIPVKFNPTEATAYNISDETLSEIIGKLSDEQKSFVDEMQDYLSTVMGEKGNEVSLVMYGVKLFKEKFYFPLKSAQQFMAKAKEQQQGEVKIKNSGFSKETVQKASNPIVLTPFMNVWANHVNEMSMYHAFVLPMEDFYRVYNYKTPTSDTMATESVEMFIQNAYGKGATGYIDQLLKDLNGGARTDTTTGIINKMTGLFKKGAVFASLSVVVQQPSAMARAAALVDTKYFIGPKVDHKRHKALWNEVKQYAPVAIIKEMGYFDTNMGKSTQDFILGKEYGSVSEKMKALVTDSNYRDEVLSKAPALADEIAWCGIWEAVKRETKTKNPGMDVKSEDFLKKAGERFTDVIVKTQVYDSALSRSGMMRSKDTGMKMATAFMAEPTTSINMIADALLQGKRGNKRYARSAIGAVIASQILNSILVSFVYAGRDDDEDETYVEKYIGTLTGEMLDSLNPATYIPFVKDIVSIVQGYDVERSDMAVISDLWSAWQNLSKDNVSPYRKVEGFAGSIAQIFGLPVKNIMRDARGIYQTIMSFVNGEQTTGAGIGYAIKGAITGRTVSDQQQLYDAYLSGDQAQIDRVMGRFEDQDAVDGAMRSAIKEHFESGDIDSSTANKYLVEFGGMEMVDAYWRVKEWKTKNETGDDFVKYKSFYTAVETGKDLKAVIKEYTDNGVSTDTLKTQITEHFKPLYIDMTNSEKANIKGYILNAMTILGMDRKDAEAKVKDWEFESKYGFSYSDRADAYKSGKVSASELKSILMNIGGKTSEEADLQIEAYDWEAQGYEGVTSAAIREYNEYCAASDVPKDVYLHIRSFANNTENDKDANGKTIYYSAMRKIMAEIDDQYGLTSSQKTAIARSLGWAEKNISKYKTW